MNHEEGFADEIAAELDRCEEISIDELHEVVTGNGTCMWLATSGQSPAWTGDDRTDRMLAVPICAGCPVWRECLELEFRQAGYATTDVWGPLPASDRRAVFAAWLERRDGGRR